MKTAIIAELGSCHDGNLTIAANMVIDAADAGADYVKLQYWSSAKRLADRRRSGAHYEAIYEKYQIGTGWLATLVEVAKVVKVGFMCTSYLPEDIPVVAPFVDHFKVASFEAADLDFIRAHYRYLYNNNRWLIVSTGLQHDDTLRPLMNERAAAKLRGAASITMKLLHCVSAYPAPVSSLAMRQIRTMDFDGFSDHAATRWIASGAVAVALGAKILEVHVRPEKMDEDNPDAPHALNPLQFRHYVRNVRAADEAIGDEPWRSRHNPAEDAMRPYKVQP